MTWEVIDAVTSARWAGAVNTPYRYDATLRAVIWTDALLSAGMALVAMLSPLLIVVPLPGEATRVIGVTVLVSAVVLAGLGAVTAVLLAARMRAGHGQVPPNMRLPLPRAMRPDQGDAAGDGAPACSRPARADMT